MLCSVVKNRRNTKEVACQGIWSLQHEMGGRGFVPNVSLFLIMQINQLVMIGCTVQLDHVICLDT